MEKIVRISWFLAALLVGCGGGGGGGGGGSGSDDSNGMQVSFSTSSLSFNYIEGQTPTVQTMTASASGSTDKDLYMGAVINGPGIATPINVVVNPVARNATITVMPTVSLAEGTYTGTIQMLACTTQSCTQHHSGSPHTVSYTVTVRPHMRASVSSISLASSESGASAASPVTLTLPQPMTAVNASVAYQNTQTGWLSVQVNGSAVTVQALANAMPPGNYTAILTLSLADNSQSLTIPVSLVVSDGLIAPSGTTLKVDNTTTAQQMRGTAAISLAPGVNASGWSASSNQAWLKLDASSGSFNTPLTWHIDTSAYEQLANNLRHRAVVTVQTNNGISPKTFTVDADKALAEIKSIDSVALVESQGGDVMIYGSGFDALSTPAGFLSVTSATPSSVTRLGNGLLRVTMPALQAGNYDMTLTTVSGMATPRKTLKVTSRASYAYQALDTQGLKSAMVWDAVSKSVFVVNRTLKSVMRYAAVNGQFQLAATRSFSFVDGIAMTPDHSALVLQSGGTKVYKLSPTDLTTLATFDVLTNSFGSTNDLSVPLPVMGDNRLLHPSVGWVDLDTGTTSALSLHNSSSILYHLARWGAVSGNGQRMLWSDSGLYSPHTPAVRFDLADATFSQFGYDTQPEFFYRYAVNRDGSSWAIYNKVYSFDLTVKGQFQAPTNWVGGEMVMSRNGTRLYNYTQNGAQENARIYVFDTSVPVTNTVNFPILGYIEVNDRPNCPYNPNSGYDNNCHTFNTHIAITDDEQTLFLAGDTKFVVVPIPTELRSSTGPAPNAMVRMPASQR